MKNYHFEIKENPFHGGEHVAYSNSLAAAVARAKRGECKDCACGGRRIIDLSGKMDRDDIAYAIYQLKA